jgi:hypothetical protein
MFASWNSDEDEDDPGVAEAAETWARSGFSLAPDANNARRGVDHHHGCLLSSESTSWRRAFADAASNARATRINPDASIVGAARCAPRSLENARVAKLHEFSFFGRLSKLRS